MKKPDGFSNSMPADGGGVEKKLMVLPNSVPTMAPGLKTPKVFQTPCQPQAAELNKPNGLSNSMPAPGGRVEEKTNGFSNSLPAASGRVKKN